MKNKRKIAIIVICIIICVIIFVLHQRNTKGIIDISDKDIIKTLQSSEEMISPENIKEWAPDSEAIWYDNAVQKNMMKYGKDVLTYNSNGSSVIKKGIYIVFVYDYDRFGEGEYWATWEKDKVTSMPYDVECKIAIKNIEIRITIYSEEKHMEDLDYILDELEDYLV